MAEELEGRYRAERDVERIRQRGEEQLAAQRDLTIRRLRAEIGALSLEAAERRVRAELADESARSGTVDGFLDELGGLSGATTRTATTAAGTGGNI